MFTRILSRIFSKSPAEDSSEMKTVTFRGGVLTFRLPRRWEETTGTSFLQEGIYYNEREDEGELTLTLFSCVVPGVTFDSQADAAQGSASSGSERRSLTASGDRLHFSREEAVEEGDPVHRYNWRITRFDQGVITMANFCWTLAAEQSAEAAFIRLRDQLDLSISCASFDPGLAKKVKERNQAETPEEAELKRQLLAAYNQLPPIAGTEENASAP